MKFENVALSFYAILASATGRPAEMQATPSLLQYETSFASERTLSSTQATAIDISSIKNTYCPVEVDGIRMCEWCAFFQSSRRSNRAVLSWSSTLSVELGIH